MIACIGKFDALHRGHRALVDQAATMGSPLLRPLTGMAEVLGWPARAPLLTAADRDVILSAWSAQIGVTVSEQPLDFSTIRALDLGAFLARLRAEGAHGIVVGEDFRGGHQRAQAASDVLDLAPQFGLTAAVVSAVCDSNGPVSSSRVRQAITSGAVETAAALLDRPYRISGTVVRGEGRGRQLGFPTANLAEITTLIPGVGVYGAWASCAEGGHQRWPAAVNIGHLPTISDHRPLTVEAYLLGFNADLYGRTLQLDFHLRIRDEQRFPNRDVLISQIHADSSAVRAALSTA